MLTVMESLWHFSGAQSSYCLLQRSHFGNVSLRTPLLLSALFGNMPLPALNSTGRGPHRESARRIPVNSNIYWLLKPVSYFMVRFTDIDKSASLSIPKDELARFARPQWDIDKAFNASPRQVHHSITTERMCDNMQSYRSSHLRPSSLEWDL